MTTLSVPDLSWSVATPFFEAASQRKLAFPKCRGCGQFVWYPKPRCPGCRGAEFDWTEISGEGWVHSFTVVRRAFLLELEARVPFGLVIARFDDAPGICLVTALASGDPLENLRVDAPLQIVFENSDGGRLMPMATLLSRHAQ